MNAINSFQTVTEALIFYVVEVRLLPCKQADAWEASSLLSGFRRAVNLLRKDHEREVCKRPQPPLGFPPAVCSWPPCIIWECLWGHQVPTTSATWGETLQKVITTPTSPLQKNCPGPGCSFWWSLKITNMYSPNSHPVLLTLREK